MSNSKPLTTVTTGRKGRPQSLRKKAETLIGVSGVAVLHSNDIYLIHGSLARELALIVGESTAEPPTQPEQKPNEIPKDYPR